MHRDHRLKASEIHRDANYVFAQKVGFEQAFPEVEDVVVRVEEKGRGLGRFRDEPRTRTYTKQNLGEYADCSNSLCYNGGVSIGQFLREAVRNRQTSFEDTAICQGYEGSPKGYRKYRDCINFFKVTGEITYKQTSPEDS